MNAAGLTGLLRHSTTIVWGGLVLATMISWWLGTDHGFGSEDDPEAATLVIILVAFIKVRFVGLWFMELRDAPLPLRIVFETYCLVVCAVVMGFYLFA